MTPRHVTRWTVGRPLNTDSFHDVNFVIAGGTEHYNDVIMFAMASQITSLTIVYSSDYSGTDQRKHQSSASLAFVRGIHRWPVNSPHKGPVTRKMFPFHDVMMKLSVFCQCVPPGVSIASQYRTPHLRRVDFHDQTRGAMLRNFDISFVLSPVKLMNNQSICR